MPKVASALKQEMLSDSSPCPYTTSGYSTSVLTIMVSILEEMEALDLYQLHIRG